MSADDPLKPKPDEELYRLMRGAVGIVPILGPVAQEMFAGVIADPAQKRRDEFMREIFERLERLAIDVEELKKKTNFQVSFIQASQIVLRTADHEKVAYLKNAVINSALSEDLSDMIRHIFMQRLDALTPQHIRLLSVIANPSQYYFPQGIMFGGLMDMIGSAIPQLKGRRDFTKALLNDLEQMNFVSDINLGVTMSAQGLMAGRTTELGSAFLEFIARHD